MALAPGRLRRRKLREELVAARFALLQATAETPPTTVPTIRAIRPRECLPVCPPCSEREAGEHRASAQRLRHTGIVSPARSKGNAPACCRLRRAGVSGN